MFIIIVGKNEFINVPSTEFTVHDDDDDDQNKYNLTLVQFRDNGGVCESYTGAV